MNKKPHSQTYSSSGVNIDKANELVEEIKPIIKRTKRLGANIDIGGFGGLFDINALGYQDPLLVSATDGVGTKLLLAIESKKFDTIGIDLVAMCVNDLVVQGAEPLFFLDYFATGSLSKDIAKQVITSITEGCIQSNCALIGGETAEMPDFYEENHFDLAGFCVGMVERNNLLPKEVSIDDAIIGIASNGLHSNGFSLVRKIINEENINLSSKTPFSNLTFIDELLKPTKIYVNSLLNILKNNNGVKALAHITGGGITENLPRVFNSVDLQAEINVKKWERPKLFEWLQEMGNIDEDEMLKTFNCGIGMALIVDPSETDKIIHQLTSQGDESILIGKIVSSSNKDNRVIYK